MLIKTIIRNGRKHASLSDVTLGDAMFVIPYLILCGMSDKEASEGFKKVMLDGELQYTTGKIVAHVKRS